MDAANAKTPASVLTAESAPSIPSRSSVPGYARRRGIAPAPMTWGSLSPGCSPRCGRSRCSSSGAASPSARCPVAFDDKSLDGYIDVAQRIAEFRVMHPEGSLQPADPAMPYHVVRVPAGWCQQCIGRRAVKDRGAWKTCSRCEGSGIRGHGEPGEDVFIGYTAAAYRSQDDARPGIGSAWEPFPGRTPYTAGSELQNAETSAWGRAIIAVGASDAKGGIASRQEVHNRRAAREAALPVNADGTLSRSRTTDAEKEQAGVMTSAQQAEHTALRKGADGKLPPAEHAKVETVTATPPDDPFYGIPGNGTRPRIAGLPDDDQAPEDRPGTADPGQIREVNIRLTSHGLTRRDERLAYLAEQFGREFHSTSEMAYSEAAKVLREMPARPKAIAP